MKKIFAIILLFPLISGFTISEANATAPERCTGYKKCKVHSHPEHGKVCKAYIVTSHNNQRAVYFPTDSNGNCPDNGKVTYCGLKIAAVKTCANNKGSCNKKNVKSCWESIYFPPPSPLPDVKLDDSADNISVPRALME